MVSQTEGKVGGQSVKSLDWTLEVAGGLELQLVSHGMDLETIQPGKKLVGRSPGPVWMHHAEHEGNQCQRMRHLYGGAWRTWGCTSIPLGQ